MEIELSGAANAITRHDFLPFGEELAGAMRSGNGYGGASGTKQRFTGYERDTETGLDFAQARYMSSIQGRFTSVDPDNAGAVFDDPQSWNAYAYVGNHPTTTTDPSGLVWAANGVSKDIHWFNTYGEYYEAVKLDKNWYIVDGHSVFITRSGSPQNPNHDYLRTGHRYTLYADGAVFDATAPYNPAGALARQMQLRAAATKQAIGIVAKLNLEPVLIIFGGELAYAYMYGTGITTLGLSQAAPVVGGAGVFIANNGTSLTKLLEQLGTTTKAAGEFFGWGNKTELLKSLSDFSTKELLANGWTRENLIKLANAYGDQVTRAVQKGFDNPAARVRAQQAIDLANKHFPE